MFIFKPKCLKENKIICFTLTVVNAGDGQEHPHVDTGEETMSKRRRLTPVALTLTDCVSSVGHAVQLTTMTEHEIGYFAKGTH